MMTLDDVDRELALNEEDFVFIENTEFKNRLTKEMMVEGIDGFIMNDKGEIFEIIFRNGLAYVSNNPITTENGLNNIIENITNSLKDKKWLK